jgi:peptidyl-prolyl cis-trans isomerase C
MSREDYEQLVAAPALAKQKVQDALAAKIGQSAAQIRAAHILVPTREAAEAARERVTTGGEDFGTVAREVSIDSSTAANGGELGWFTRQEMVAPFADAAFSLPAGQISEPIQTVYGWHIIHVEETDPNRPLTDAQISRLKQAAIDQWLDEQRSALKVSSSLPPTPTPGVEPFQPPADVPTPPVATPAEPVPAATPLGGLAGTPVG